MFTKIAATSRNDIEDEPMIPFYGSGSRSLTVKGVVGDGIMDDTLAIQRAIRKASKNDARAEVVLPKAPISILKSL